MPKKKVELTQEQQSELFRMVVRDLVDAGELNPTEADKAFERLVSRSRTSNLKLSRDRG